MMMGKEQSKPELYNVPTVKPNRLNRDEINILVIGQTGVGKSSFIDAAINLLLFDTFEELCLSGPIQAVETDNLPANDEEFGESQTRDCTTYQVIWRKSRIHFIDTPGIGDTGGKIQDQENMNNILDHIKHVDHLHVICFLFKSTETRLTEEFKYCLDTLLTHLHKDAANNIFIGYTFSKASNFQPGPTKKLIKSKLKNTSIVQYIDDPNRNFCFDNDWCYVSSLRNTGVDLPSDDVRCMKKSWEKSGNELKRLLYVQDTLQPHKVLDTVSINDVRRVITSLMQILVKVMKNIEVNIKRIHDFERALSTMRTSERKFIQFCKVRARESIALVCASDKCAIKQTGKKFTSCLLHPDIEKFIPLTGTKFRVREYYRRCPNCRCYLHSHRIIRVQFEQADENLGEHTTPEDLKKILQDMRNAERTIIQSTAVFGRFIRTNALINDTKGMYLYLQHSVDESCLSQNILKMYKKFEHDSTNAHSIDLFDETYQAIQRLKKLNFLGLEITEALKDVTSIEVRGYKKAVTVVTKKSIK